MSRSAGKKGRTLPAVVVYFPKRERPTATRSAFSGVTQTITERRWVEDPEFPTEFFFVPDLFAAVEGQGSGRSHPAPAQALEKGRTRASAPRRRAVKRAKTSPAKCAPAPGGGRSASAPRVPSRSALRAQLARRGHRCFEKGMLEDARQIFEELVQDGPADAFAHTMLGTIHHAQGNGDLALPLFDRALKLDEKDVAARVYRGEIQLGRGALGKAMTDLRIALRGGDHEDPFVQRAAALLERLHLGAGAVAR